MNYFSAEDISDDMDIKEGCGYKKRYTHVAVIILLRISASFFEFTFPIFFFGMRKNNLLLYIL